MERPTFSQSWSRVSKLTPILRPHVQIHRQLYRGEPWHVMRDPIGNNFFRLGPVAYHLVGLFDGRRNIDEVWRMTLDRYGDEAPTQNEVITLLSQLNQSNLIRVDLPADAEPLLKRRRQRQLRHWGGQAMSILFIRIPLFNPDRMLTWLLPMVKWMLNKWMLAASLIWVVSCLAIFLPHIGRFLRSADNVLEPENWGYMVVLFIVVKAIHEVGHGLVCKKLGGLVPEMGIMMLVLFPAPFVDATSAWDFDSKWKRLVVGAAGMIFELPIAGAAVLVWLNTEPGLPHQLAYNLIFLASVTTILFNANPLLRFDGYYMLSDILDIPNLYQRAQQQLKWLIKRFAYGMDQVQPPTGSFAERTELTIYGICALIYRVLILFGIILFITGKLASLGIALAIWSAISWGLVPLGKFLHWMVTNPQLHEHRARAVMVTVGFVAAMLLLLGAVPMPEHRRMQGVIESTYQPDIAMQSDGLVIQVFKQSGDKIQEGDVILIAENKELDARGARLETQLQGFYYDLDQAIAEDQKARKIAWKLIERTKKDLIEVKQQIADLVVTSPRNGTLIGPIFMDHLEGQFLRKGQVIARIVDLDDIRVTALADQSQSSVAFMKSDAEGKSYIRRVELRTVGNIGRVIESKLIKATPAGRSRIDHHAFTRVGGGKTALDPADQSGQKALHPQFELWFSLPDDIKTQSAEGTLALYPGQRVYVRLTLPNRPLLAQWGQRLHQLVRRRLMG